MKRLWVSLVVAIGLAVASSAFAAPTLKVGDTAPKINVSKWVKGDPITKLDPANIYVIEFWATWCGPCKQSIPHLTELAHKYKDKVTFIGISIWEHGSDVNSFVKNMGDKMDYRVATDNSDNYMATSWMTAAGERGIPCAFVIGKDNKIQWVGHPMSGLDKVLDKIIEGNFDCAAYAEQRLKEQALAEKFAEMRTEIEALDKQKKPKEALDKLNSYIVKYPEFEMDCIPIKIKLMFAVDEPTGYTYIRKLADNQLKDNQSALIWLANSAVDSRYNLKTPDNALAVSIGKRAVELSKAQDAYILSEMAKLYEKSGDLDNAIASQDGAVKIASNDKDWPKDAVDNLKTRLQELKDKKK